MAIFGYQICQLATLLIRPKDIYQRLRKGEVGRIQIVRTVSRDSPTMPFGYIVTSGGIFFDSLCHDVDLITYMMGELPTKERNITKLQSISHYRQQEINSLLSPFRSTPPAQSSTKSTRTWTTSTTSW